MNNIFTPFFVFSFLLAAADITSCPPSLLHFNKKKHTHTHYTSSRESSQQEEEEEWQKTNKQNSFDISQHSIQQQQLGIYVCVYIIYEGRASRESSKTTNGVM